LHKKYIPCLTTSHCFLRLLNLCYDSYWVLEAIERVCYRTYVRCVRYIRVYGVRVSRGCAGYAGCRVRATTTRRPGRQRRRLLPPPFLLYLLCRRDSDDGGRGTGVRGRYFLQRAVRLQLLFQRKFANGEPLSPLVRRSCVGFHILRGDFFSPSPSYTHTHTYTHARTRTRTYIYRRQDANVRRVRASRFLCPDPGQRLNKVRPAGWLTRDRWMAAKNAVTGPTKDHRREILPRNGPPVPKWIFAFLVFLAIAPSRVEWNSAHRNAVTRENRVYRKSLDLPCAPCTPAGFALQGTKTCATKGRG